MQRPAERTHKHGTKWLTTARQVNRIKIQLTATFDGWKLYSLTWYLQSVSKCSSPFKQMYSLHAAYIVFSRLDVLWQEELFCEKLADKCGYSDRITDQITIILSAAICARKAQMTSEQINCVQKTDYEYDEVFVCNKIIACITDITVTAFERRYSQ